MRNNNRDLTPLARVGVLWLNTCLTVRAHVANSHAKKGWESFTDAVLQAVLDRNDDNGVVFLAWGLPAQKTCGRLSIDEVRDSRVHFIACSRSSPEKAFSVKVLQMIASLLARLIYSITLARSPHPSPLSAHKGFLGNGHFKKANEWLRERSGVEIDWTVLCSEKSGAH